MSSQSSFLLLVDRGARTCNALLAALVASDEVTSASRVLEAMDAGAAAAADGFSLGIMMRGYGARRQLGKVESLWRRITDAGSVDAVALNTYLNACARCGDVPRAMQAFQRAKVDLPSLTLDKVTPLPSQFGPPSLLPDRRSSHAASTLR